MTPSEIIMSGTNRADLLNQVAEECCELAHAALKLRRTMPDSTNPTPVDAVTAEANFREEIADVLLTLMYATNYDVALVASRDIEKIAEEKEVRWAQRLSR